MTLPMSTIDAHVHLYPREVNADPAGWARTADENQWAALSLRVRRNGTRVQSFPSVQTLLCDMDAGGVDRAVLLGWYWEHPATARLQNRFFAECLGEHRDRFAAFATFHPSAGLEATRAEIYRCRDAGFSGLGELSPHAQGFSCRDAGFLAALELAAELRLPVNLHVTDPESGNYPGRVETPLRDFLELARAFPNVNFILAHWGGRLPLLHPEARELGNIYYDTAASPLLYDVGIWAKFREVVPDERILFGSDYPLNIYPREQPEPDLARFVAEARQANASELILSGNVRNLISPAI